MKTRTKPSQNWNPVFYLRPQGGKISGRLLLSMIFLGASLIMILKSEQQLDQEKFLGGYKTSEPLLMPPSQLERFTFGYTEFIADLLWIRAIQDFEFCGHQMKYEGFSFSVGKNLQMCKKGWIYQMLDAITRISPRYHIVYTRGAVALSVVVSDLEGAALLLERGTLVFPKDWYIQYCAGYHYGVEMAAYEKAAIHMREAGKYGAPEWTTLLAAKLFNQAGQAEFGRAALKEFYKDIPYREWPDRAKERLQELQTQHTRWQKKTTSHQ